MAKAMQRHHFGLKARLVPVFDQLTDRLLSAAAAQVVDDMQNPVPLGVAGPAHPCPCQSLPFFIAAQ